MYFPAISADHDRGQKRHQHADHEATVIGIGEHAERDSPTV